MILELIQRSFDIRNAAHREHWATKNGEQHRALGEFYDGVISGLDKYVEAYQGVFGTVEKSKDVTERIRKELIWLSENRSMISKEIPALENIIDELCGMYMTTLYKLENLR
jgi:uncharacterized protein Yka (UPF0111/DUF47 family)